MSVHEAYVGESMTPAAGNGNVTVADIPPTGSSALSLPPPSTTREEASITGNSATSMRTSSFAMSDISKEEKMASQGVDSSRIRKAYLCSSRNRNTMIEVVEKMEEVPNTDRYLPCSRDVLTQVWISESADFEW
jgi:hypothetical protein